MEVEKVLEIIRDEALLADTRAADACSRSKYSIQDYFMCIEFYLQNLHDRIAREAGLSVRCPHYPMRVKIAALRKEVSRELKSGPTLLAGDLAEAAAESFHGVVEMVNPENPHWRKTPSQ